MRIGVETASQISDDDCQGGGICPSCRLAINKDTGRLKWCMGGNDIWRTRIRFMLLIPAVILPITIIIIALSKSTVIGKLSMRPHQTGDEATDNSNSAIQTDTNVRLIDDRLFIPTIQNDIEQSEVANRLPHPDAETSFLPGESLIASHALQRHKRDMNQRDAARTTEQKKKKKKTKAAAVGGDGETVVAAIDTSINAKPSKRQSSSSGGGGGRETHSRDSASSSSSSSSSRGLKSELLQELRLAQARGRLVQSSPDTGTAARAAADLVDCSEDVESDEAEETSEDEDDVDDDESGSEYMSDDDEESDEESAAANSASLENEAAQLWRTRSASDPFDSETRDPRNHHHHHHHHQHHHHDDDDDDDNDDSLSYSEEDEESLDFRAFWKGDWNEDFIRKAQAKMMLRYMDKRIDPCEDFYQYSCGNWERYNPIPEDMAGYDTFETLRESLNVVLRQLLEEPLDKDADYREDSAIVKAKNLFRSCMNYEILEQRMERPLLELLNELGGWPILQSRWTPDKFDWLLLVAQLRLYNNDVLISEWVGPDIKNSDQYVIQFDQTTLGLPTKDYFLQSTNAIYLMAYKNYLITVVTLLGAPAKAASIQAEELIQFEIQLANITISPDERRNTSDLYYKRITLEEMHEMIPQIDWHRYLSIVLGRPVNYSEPVVLFATKYLQDLVKLLSQTPARTVSNYLFWRFVRHRVNNLDDRFQEAKQTFYYILFGREKSPPRWKNCVAQVNSNMGMAIGSIFVRKYFDQKSKNDTLSMTREIQRSFRELLNQSDWLDPMTKQVAGEKVEAMQLRIGYPDFILESRELDERYRDVNIHPDKYFENTLNILRHLTRIEQEKLGSPVNKSVWNAAPAVVNAYYSRNKNQIMFPAGILQPPFYHRHFPRSLNYGGIGVVIGHEITHGFDDKGRLFDKYGNFHRWWTDESINGFDQRAACLIEQFSKYVVKEVAMRIDGINTQGENIADNGGIKQAFRAYEKWLSLNENAKENLPGMNATGRQLFFINFAQIWCGSTRPEAMRNKLKTAVHSPGKYRVIGTLSNSEEFAKVFSCPLGSPMNPEKKCLVW